MNQAGAHIDLRNFETLEEAGVEIIRPDLDSFRQAVEPMYEKYLADPQLGPLIQAIQAVEGRSPASPE